MKCPACDGRCFVHRTLKGFHRSWIVQCPKCEGSGTFIDWSGYGVCAQPAQQVEGQAGTDLSHDPNVTP